MIGLRYVIYFICLCLEVVDLLEFVYFTEFIKSEKKWPLFLQILSHSFLSSPPSGTPVTSIQSLVFIPQLSDELIILFYTLSVCFFR